jgi:Golgi phosphoprotein 3 (GPP34)
MTALGEELIVASLSPDEGRYLEGHVGIRAAFAASAILDPWAAGAPLPPAKDIRKFLRKHYYNTLEQALASFVSSGRITVTHHRACTYHWLADPASRAGVRDRLVAALSGPTAPARHDAALAVLLYTGRLWGWAFDVEKPRVIVNNNGQARAAMLASGTAAPDSMAGAELSAIARLLHREIRDHGDDIRGG